MLPFVSNTKPYLGESMICTMIPQLSKPTFQSGKSCFLLHLFNKLDMAATKSRVLTVEHLVQLMGVAIYENFFSIFSRQKVAIVFVPFFCTPRSTIWAPCLACTAANEGSKITRLWTFVSHWICKGMLRLQGGLKKWSIKLKPTLKHVNNMVRRKQFILKIT